MMKKSITELWDFYFHRKCLWPSKGFHLLLVLACILLHQVVCGPCGPCSTRNYLVPCMDGMQGPLDNDACRPYIDNDAGFQDILLGDTSSVYTQLTPGCSRLKYACTDYDSFCFPSTLPGYVAEEDSPNVAILEIPEDSDAHTSSEGSVLNNNDEFNSSWSAAHATFMLLNGRRISCSLSPQRELHDEVSPQRENVDCKGPSLPNVSMDKTITTTLRDGFSSPHVSINPPLLDWGLSHLFVPSLASLTVVNTCNDSMLYIYKPSSTDPQFYEYDFDEITLAPGEATSIAFIFLPRWLGSSSAHLVVQTSLGGFLIRASGLAIESPYGIQPLVGLSVLSNGKMSKNLSLHNPFDDILYVEEITAWISVSSEKSSNFAQAVCRLDVSQSSDELNSLPNDKEWWNVKSGQLGLPLIGIRPDRQWEVEPQSTETILEINFLSSIEGKFFGAFCLQLQSPSRDMIETIIVPLEAEVHGRVAHSSYRGSVSVFLESIVRCDGKDSMVVAVSLRNDASYFLRVVKIIEDTESVKLFQVRYMEGLILFPGTTTYIAEVIYTPPDDSQDSPPEIPSITPNCKLLIVTDDLSSPQIEIPCQDIVPTCSRPQPYSDFSVSGNSYIGLEAQHGNEKSANTRTGSLGGNIQSQSPVKWKVSEIEAADELILRNWRSQGTISGMSVLEEHEILFSTVQVGTHCSKWISVNNPSHNPVIMQLVLNSGAVIDQCGDVDESLKQPLLSSFVHNDSMKISDGFSLAETAVTDAFVQPYGRALFGPIIFHPSNRCVWRSTVLIRNNLSGVECLPLRGLGGSLSLVLLEGSEPVQSLEFSPGTPTSLNISTPEPLFYMESTDFLQPLSKELYAKNTGDLPLEVRRIEVSGTACGKDGFTIHECTGFSLAPGESMKLLISYQSDFCTAVVHRDLELSLVTGIFVFPMTTSLPAYMLRLCKKPILGILMWKLVKVVVFAALVTSLAFFCISILPQPMTYGAQDHLFKSDKNSIATSNSAGKTCRPHRNPRNTRSVREVENAELDFPARYSDRQSSVQELDITTQHVKQARDNHDRIHYVSDHQKKTQLSPSPSSSKMKPMTVAENSIISEAPQTGNLTVRIEKERGKRRKRRAALTGKLEASSSQSGNSTPSSPLSPLTSFIPKRTPLSPDIQQSVDSHDHSFTRKINQSHEEHVFEAVNDTRILEPKVSTKSYDHSWPSVPKQVIGKSVLLPSATFPCRRAPSYVGTPLFSSPTAIAPHARAPGSKVIEGKRTETEDTGGRREFTYDIWGNHFSEFHLMGRPKEFSANISDDLEDDSQSFFVRGPQSLMQKSTERSVSPAPEFSIYAVNFLDQMS
ncbi:uncharacterized protein LOC143847845 isoform X2 [Tasmannia lanceolata]|uniref:uncharacterized protein LOC143847845 isoform X2 n=1 Tax=Tasmannia lanceolata TaxID=3420 RepID=UPI00406329F6